MIASIAVILACQLAGEVLTRGLGLPVPGPVLGMVALFAVLALRARLPEPPAWLGVEPVGRFLLANLSLLFVPAGVGVVICPSYQVIGWHWRSPWWCRRC